jgi:RNA polymerase sigma factor (sigma-70 family)
MKNFNKKIYALNMASLKHIDSNIPKKYFKLAYNIANSFSKEYASIGVSNINDLIQESFLALLISWRNIKWDLINKIEDDIDRKKAVTNYLKKSIIGLVRDEIKKNVDGTKKPIKGIWDNKTKTRRNDVFGFLTVLFPHWFDTNVLTTIEDEIYDYDYEKLAEYFDQWFERHLPKYKDMMLMLYGIDDVYSKAKSISEIAVKFNMKPDAVKKQKQRLLKKIKNNEVALNELAFYVVTNSIKSSSKVYDYAENNLKIYAD